MTTTKMLGYLNLNRAMVNSIKIARTLGYLNLNRAMVNSIKIARRAIVEK